MTTALHSTPMQRHRLPLPDALRGIAAFLVAFWHMPLFLGLQQFVQRSYLAVDFFFCLSGFVVAFSYERRLEQDFRLSNFTVARLIRLYPVYFLATIVGLAIVLIAGYPFHTLAFAKARFALLVITGVLLLPTHGKPSAALYPLDFPAWSLFFELCANIGFALLVRKGWASRKALIAAVTLSLLTLLCWVFQGGLIGAIGWESRLPPFLMGFPRVVFSFGIGILLLRLHRTRTSAGWGALLRRTLPIALTLILICTLLAPLRFMRTEVFNLLTISLIYPGIVYLAACAKIPTRLDRVCSYLGEASYPLYLLHVFFLRLLFTTTFERYASVHPQFAQAIAVALLVFALIVSNTVARFYETPVRRLLTRFYNTRFVSTPAPTPQLQISS